VARDIAHKEGSNAIHAHKNVHAQGLIRFGFSRDDLTNLMQQTTNSDVGLANVVGKSFDYSGRNPNKPILSTSTKAMMGPRKNNSKVTMPPSRQSKLFERNSDLQITNIISS